MKIILSIKALSMILSLGTSEEFLLSLSILGALVFTKGLDITLSSTTAVEYNSASGVNISYILIENFSNNSL